MWTVIRPEGFRKYYHEQYVRRCPIGPVFTEPLLPRYLPIQWKIYTPKFSKNHSLPIYYNLLFTFCQIPFDEATYGAYNKVVSKKSSNSRKFSVHFPNSIKKSSAPYRKWLIKHHKQLEKRVVAFILVILVTFSCVLIFVFVELLDQYQALQEEQASMKNELVYWEQAIATVPNSPDLYFQAAVVAFQLGDKNRASDYVVKALQLDPNFEHAKQLQEKILKE